MDAFGCGGPWCGGGDALVFLFFFYGGVLRRPWGFKVRVALRRDCGCVPNGGVKETTVFFKTEGFRMSWGCCILGVVRRDGGFQRRLLVKTYMQDHCHFRVLNSVETPAKHLSFS